MLKQRLPLPGEKPRTIWQPRKHRATPGRTSIHIPRWLIFWIGGLAVIGTAVWLWLATGTPVTVIANGRPIQIRTHSQNVGGAVEAAGVKVDQTAFVDPPLDTPLSADMVITVAYLRPVIVHADGQTLLATTRSTSPYAIVSELGIRLDADDEVHVDRAVRPSPAAIQENPALAAAPIIPREITVRRAQTLIVSENGTQVSFRSAAPTLGEALYRAGYTLYEADIVTPALATLVPAGGLEVTIVRSTPFTLEVGGKSRPMRTQKHTVGEALADQGLALSGQDYVLPGLDAPVPPGGTIRLVRVLEVTRSETVSIPFETRYVPDQDLELDQLVELQAGRAGELTRQVVMRQENGVEISRMMTAEWLAAPPQARVVAYGTRIIIRTAQTPDGAIKYWRKLRVLATSYSPLTAGDKQPGDLRFGISGTGAPVRQGVIAVDPSVIALGTYLYVPGYGAGRALDTGGAVKGMRIDLGYEDPIPALWNSWVEIYLTLPVPSPDRVVWVLPVP